MEVEIVGKNGEVAIVVLESAVDTAIVGIANAEESRGVGHRQRAQQDALHQREDGRIGADAEGQRQHRGQA